MPQTYEIADFDSHTPFRCMVHHIGHIRPHVHDFFEILFILSGRCNVTVDDQLFQLSDGDLLIIEGHTPHELRSSDCVYASVQLDQTTLENNFPVPMHPSFRCNSTFPGNEEAFDRLRGTIARLIQNNADEQNGYELRNWILIYQLMDILYTYFRVERSEASDRRNHRYAERIAEIARIIHTHYTEDLPLSAVADMVHLSVPYLSKFFQEHFGINYLSYLTQLRVNHAVHEVVNTRKTIEEIALDSGFGNSHAFTQAFYKEYGCMPSVYRRQQKRNKKNDPVLGIEHSDYLSNLRKYLDLDIQQLPGDLPALSAYAGFSAKGTMKELRHTWRNMLSVGKAADILLSDIQDILRQVRREIGFQYLFFNGILSDELHVCEKNTSGSLMFHFTYVDAIFDFLTEVGYTPFVSFSYMPSVIAKDSGRMLFNHLVSEPYSLQQWCDLIKAFMEHICRRYGNRAVSEWRFCVWHQPNTTSRLYGFEKDEVFFRFYKATCDTVKQVLPEAHFGMPAVFENADHIGDEWVDRMLAFCMKENMIPDFLNYSYYDTKLSEGHNNTRQAFGFVFTMSLNNDPNGLRTFIRRMIEKHKNQGLSSLPVYLSEWNNTPSQQDLLNDTCYKSCYLVKNLLENYDRLDSFSYWSLSDLMSEALLPEDLLFGGLGLFTKNGLPKASYNALRLLRQLGDHLIARGEGWTATRTESEIRILVYHYVHLSRLYASGERFIMTPTDRYTMFRSSKPLTFHLSLTDMEDGQYQAKEYLVGRSAGSLYDVWAASGCISGQNKTDRELLRAGSMPSVRQYTVKACEGSLSISIHLDPLDVKLIVIRL